MIDLDVCPLQGKRVTVSQFLWSDLVSLDARYVICTEYIIYILLDPNPISASFHCQLNISVASARPRPA